MKGISVVLILAICVGNIFCHMPVLAAETSRMTMTELYNDGDCLPVEEGDIVTIESLEEWEMFAKYSDEGYGMRGVTVELLNDIKVSHYTFSYDEETMRIGISWDGSLEAAYDVNSESYYEDFYSDQVIDYQWRGAKLSTVEYFHGVFDGKRHYITGVYNESRESGGMLFGKIDGGQIANLNISHFFSVAELGGTLCGTLTWGDVIYCHGSNLFLAGDCIGGLVGKIPQSGHVGKCSAEVHLFPKDFCGGIVGRVEQNQYTDVRLDGNYVSGLIYGTGSVGGILGYGLGSSGRIRIDNCTSEVNIAGGENTQAGGIAGISNSYMENCENRGNISVFGKNAKAGGLLAGEDSNTESSTIGIDRCRNTGKIRSSDIAGGIVGIVRGIEMVDTENRGDVCFEDREGGSGVSKQNQVGIGGIIGRVENRIDSKGNEQSPNVIMLNSCCSGNVMGGKIHAGGLIGAIGAKGSFLSIKNVCFYGKVEAEEEVGIILGEVDTAAVESLSTSTVQNVYYHEQNTSLVSGDGTEIPACMYPVSEAQMSGKERDTCIGQGDFAQTPNLCDALNRWCQVMGMWTDWEQGETFPVLRLKEVEKPEKPDTTVIPTEAPTQAPTETPTVEPTEQPTEEPTEQPTATIEPTEQSTEEPTARPTVKPTEKPTPTIEPTEKPIEEPTEQPTAEPTVRPTVKPTEEPTPTIEPTKQPTAPPTLKPTVKPTENPVITPTVTPTITPTITPTPKPTKVPTENPAIEPTVEPTENPVQTEPPSTPPTGVFIPTETEMPTPSPNQGITPTPTPSPITASTPPSTAGTTAKAKKLKAPTFSIKKKRTVSGKQYVSIRLKKYKGTHAEIWVGKQKKKGKKFVYYKLKLKQNSIRKVKRVFNFLYAKQKGTLAFKIRTYAKQGKKRIYSHKSKAKRIRLS